MKAIICIIILMNARVQKWNFASHATLHNANQYQMVKQLNRLTPETIISSKNVYPDLDFLMAIDFYWDGALSWCLLFFQHIKIDIFC